MATQYRLKPNALFEETGARSTFDGRRLCGAMEGEIETVLSQRYG